MDDASARSVRTPPVASSVADRLLDQVQIIDLLYGYASAVDTCDWVLFRSLFNDTVELDFSAVNGQPAGLERVEMWMGYLAALRNEVIATQHLVTNARVFLDGDRATCEANVRGEHVLSSGSSRSIYTIGARYKDVFVRTAHGWRFQRIAVDLIWDDGDGEAMASARERAIRALSLQPK
jgi:hypothetical protein